MAIKSNEESRYCFNVFFYIALAGCSAQTKEKFLRTFFDGVPPVKETVLFPASDSKVRAAKEIEVKPAITKEPAVFFHPPFLEKQCDSCHDTKFSQKLTLVGKDLCFTCHDDFTKNKKIVHVPVSEGACTDCHDPHQSPNRFFLKKSLPQICFSCHDEKDIKANPAHEGKNICTECHNPHTSNEEKLLK